PTRSRPRTCLFRAWKAWKRRETSGRNPIRTTVPYITPSISIRASSRAVTGHPAAPLGVMWFADLGSCRVGRGPPAAAKRGPGWDVDSCRREIEACVAKTARAHTFLANNPPSIVWSGYLSHGYVMQDDPEILRVLESAHRASTQKPFQRRISMALNDSRFYGLYYGITAFCYGPTGEKSHGFNERVNIESIRETTKAIAIFVASWCGVNAD